MNHIENATLDRRRMLLGAAGLVAAGFAGTLARPRVAAASGGSSVLPAPKPIPGGTDLSTFGLSPPFDFIHIFAPGPKGVALPFSGIQLEGLDVDPSAITDFKGGTALAYIVGEAKATDGVTYGLEVDIRAMEGKYVAEDGSRNEGAFAFI